MQKECILTTGVIFPNKHQTNKKSCLNVSMSGAPFAGLVFVFFHFKITIFLLFKSDICLKEENEISLTKGCIEESRAFVFSNLDD